MIGLLPQPYRLMAGLIYGGGLRMQECLELRTKDVDFARQTVTVREGKGNKDRQTALPESLREQWDVHIAPTPRVHGGVTPWVRWTDPRIVAATAERVPHATPMPPVSRTDHPNSSDRKQ